MDSYDDAIRRLNIITQDAGWYVYCFEEEEWHLYNAKGVLLFATKTIEELADSFEPAPLEYNNFGSGTERNQPYKVNKFIEVKPTKVDPIFYETYEDKQQKRKEPS